MTIRYRNGIGEAIAMIHVKFPLSATWLEWAMIKLIMTGVISQVTAPKKLVRQLVLDIIKQLLIHNERDALDYYPDEFKEEYPGVDYLQKLDIAQMICKQYFPEFYN